MITPNSNFTSMLVIWLLITITHKLFHNERTQKHIFQTGNSWKLSRMVSTKPAGAIPVCHMHFGNFSHSIPTQPCKHVCKEKQKHNWAHLSSQTTNIVRFLEQWYSVLFFKVSLTSATIANSTSLSFDDKRVNIPVLLWIF